MGSPGAPCRSCRTGRGTLEPPSRSGGRVVQGSREQHRRRRHINLDDSYDGFLGGVGLLFALVAESLRAAVRRDNFSILMTRLLILCLGAMVGMTSTATRKDDPEAMVATVSQRGTPIRICTHATQSDQRRCSLPQVLLSPVLGVRTCTS